MRLQRLEISGFKSFPDRADLAFDHGVTAIVGPNGCGKSNVVDAITWVLGEQSARTLRGERMEDVIFSGSDARKPTASAEVRLRLSGVPVRGVGSSDGNGHSTHVEPESLTLPDDTPSIVRDVELARRLYRSGESEYLIDGHACRLRDIQDMLMDAGVGIKGYAVIEQGKIGQILSARPADRRQLIEEAAGVTKYKSRRRAAELKLEAAQQNLVRVEDIISELDKQRGSLKRQAAKARRYRRLREELRRWEKLLFARRYQELAASIEEARARLDEARQNEAGAAARVSEIETTLERLRLELAEADSAATAAREEAHASELENGRRQQQIEFDTKQIEALRVSIGEIGADIGALEANRAPLRQEIEERQRAALAADQEREQASRALETQEAALASALQELAAREGAVESARGAVYTGLNALTTLQHAIERAIESSERIAQQLARYDVEDADLRVELDRTSGERARAADALREGLAALEETKQGLAAREAECASARIERDWRLTDMRARERDLAALAARLSSLEELVSARADYGDAARFVLASAELGIEHLGSVADDLDVDRRFERAVEAVVGDLLQYVLVERHETAIRGLELVRERDLGRCGFLVVGESVPRPAASPLSTPGVLPIESVVTVNGPAAEAIRAALGPIWFAPSLDIAIAASSETSAAVVTPDGDIFRGKSLVLGGGREAGRGILATRREIKELRDKRTADQETIQQLTGEITSLEQRVAQAEQGISAFEAELHKQEKVILGFELQQARGSEECERLERRRELVASERRRTDEERASLQQREAEARQSVASLQQQQLELDAQFSAAQQALAAARQTQASSAQSATETKAMHAALVERAGAMHNDVGRLEHAAADLETRIVARHQDRERSESRLVELTTTIEENRRLLDESVQAFVVLRERVASADDRVSTLQIAFQEREVEGRERRRELDGLRQTASQLDVARATAEADMTHLAHACVETLQLSLDEVAAEITALAESGQLPSDVTTATAEEESDLGEEGEGGAEEPSTATAEAARADAAREATPEGVIAKLKAKIDRLGPVNMIAIEQSDELEQRFEFLTTQRTDLVDAIAATGEAIQRIDRTTRERFRQAFDAINLHFEQTFTTLFGGGRAGLVLLDTNDDLESGIDIIAQPPGKRLQNVQLLSGGEKALTAMALMFAIFSYRPSPFCLLDEIDAPLDDANVSRFIDMLRGMQQHTQFILVTHHRRTMEIADRLYGVTMEEPGVSKLISLKLN